MFKNDVYKEICNKNDIIEDYINIYNKNFDSNIVYLYINLTFINPILHHEYMYHFNYDWKDIDFKLSVNAKENYELDLEGIINNYLATLQGEKVLISLSQNLDKLESLLILNIKSIIIYTRL